MSLISVMVKCCFGFLVVSCVNGFALPFEGLYRLDIIHYNDFHARFMETSVDTPTCRTDDDRCLGGLPRLFHEIHLLFQQKPDAILLNAGDSFQGTYWYTLLKWNITQQLMNMLPHDAHAIGNHEFDDGPAGLAPYLSHLAAPVLAANMDVSGEPSLQGLYRSHVVLERRGRKIGVIGLITQDTKTLSSPGNVVFTDPGEATRREAQLLTEKGVDIIVLLSHCGLAVDKQLARDYGEHVDVIIGGHTHSLLWDGPPPSNEPVAGPYPVLVENTASHKQVVIVQASAFTKYMGNLSVYFDYKGDYVSWEGGPIFLNRSIPEDASIKATLAPYARQVQTAEQAAVGAAAAELAADACVFGECALGDLLCDSMLHLSKSKVATNLSHIALIQRGNIKSSILAGTITKGEIFELLPYNDRIESGEILGRRVRQALEHGVSHAWAQQPFKGPYVLQVAGLQVTYNVSKPEGSRVTSVLVGPDGEGNTTPLDSEAYYRLAAPAYLAGGGDGFTMLRERRDVRVVGRDQPALEAFIGAHSPLSYTTGRRITITY